MNTENSNKLNHFFKKTKPSTCSESRINHHSFIQIKKIKNKELGISDFLPDIHY